MGKLKEGATYIYERADGVVYAREFGATERSVIGMDYPTRSLMEQIEEDKLWGDIRRMAKTNTAMQAELDRVIMLYHLLNENGQT